MPWPVLDSLVGMFAPEPRWDPRLGRREGRPVVAVRAGTEGRMVSARINWYAVSGLAHLVCAELFLGRA